MSQEHEVADLAGATSFILGHLTERFVQSIELIADALQTLAKVEAERLRKDHPDHRVPKPAQINRASDEKREEFSDKPTDKWVAETEQALPPTRFQERFNQAAAGNPANSKKQ